MTFNNESVICFCDKVIICVPPVKTMVEQIQETVKTNEWKIFWIGFRNR